jgi:hypothetical protein
LVALRNFGLITLDLYEGDYLHFPSHWYHEVHNLSPESLALTGSIFNYFYAMDLCINEEKDKGTLNMTANAMISLYDTFKQMKSSL